MKMNHLQTGAAPSSNGVQPHRPYVMVIDDSATVRKILETCLGREGILVRSFPDGVEAMKWLLLPDSPVPSLIFLDIVLPKMDGFEVARSLKAKAQFSQTVIIMLSRHSGIVDKLKGRLAGAQEYLTKPFKTQHILAVTTSYLRNVEQDIQKG